MAFEVQLMSHNKLLTAANTGMGIFLALFCLGLVMAYQPALALPMGLTVFVHISLIVSAALFKLAYVVRLVAQDRLGQPLV